MVLPFLFAALGGIAILFVLFVFALVVFWIWMLIDVLQRKKFEDKLVWVVVMLLLPVLGSVIYYFLVKAKDKRR